MILLRTKDLCYESTDRLLHWCGDFPDAPNLKRGDSVVRPSKCIAQRPYRNIAGGGSCRVGAGRWPSLLRPLAHV